jgi:hypothetical protein
VKDATGFALLRVAMLDTWHRLLQAVQLYDPFQKNPFKSFSEDSQPLAFSFQPFPSTLPLAPHRAFSRQILRRNYQLSTINQLKRP